MRVGRVGRLGTFVKVFFLKMMMKMMMMMMMMMKMKIKGTID